MQVDIPLLTADDIECRVQSVSKQRNGVFAKILLYKNARVDMRILDQLFGVTGWQRTHEVVNGNLFCNIDIWDSEKNCWIRKQDVGVESNTAKEKGEASDSFKRAGTNVGIGRELYTSPNIKIKLADEEFSTEEKNGREIFKVLPWITFSVSHIGYNDRREINSLVIVDNYDDTRFSAGEPFQNILDRAKKAGITVITEEDKPHCSNCGAEIKGMKKKDGTLISAKEVSDNLGGLCKACWRAAQKEAQ